MSVILKETKTRADIFNQHFIRQMNNILLEPTVKNIDEVFCKDGLFSFNMLNFSPITFKFLFIKLKNIGLESWNFSSNSFEINLNVLSVILNGTIGFVYKPKTKNYTTVLKKVKNSNEKDYNNIKGERNIEVFDINNPNNYKIFAFEFGFSVFSEDDLLTEFLNMLEIYLKKCDAIFHMNYHLDHDSIILNGPIHNKLELLTIPLRRIGKIKRETSSLYSKNK